MIQIFATAFLLFTFCFSASYAQDIEQSEDFMEGYFKEIDAVAAENKAAQKAQDDASRLMSAQPTMLSLPEEQLQLLQESEKMLQQRQKTLKNNPSTDNLKINAPAKFTNTPKSPFENENPSAQHSKAPFGLYWGLSKAETQKLGLELTPVKIENHTNTYAVVDKSPNNNFASVIADFGETDRLYAVYAEGNTLNDTPEADKVLALYERYYTALKTKYGNDKQFFKSAENKTDDFHNNADFLNDLYQQKSFLYATFGDENLKITLAVEALNKDQSRITLDYINLTVQQNNKKTLLNDLMDDL